MGKELVEQQGRRVVLTPEALRLVARSRPLLADMREVLYSEAENYSGKLVLAVGSSLLSSWGAAALAELRCEMPGLRLEVNSHRGRTALDRVSSGEYMLALVAGAGELTPDLHAESVCREPMVIVPAGLKRFRFPREGVLSLISCEPQEATWSAIGKTVQRYSKRIGVQLRVEQTVQTFSACAKLAEYGFGHGFVPQGVADGFGYSKKQLVFLPEGGVTRVVSLIGRKSMFARPLVQEFLLRMRQHLESQQNFQRLTK